MVSHASNKRVRTPLPPILRFRHEDGADIHFFLMLLWYDTADSRCLANDCYPTPNSIRNGTAPSRDVSNWLCGAREPIRREVMLERQTDPKQHVCT